MKEFFRRIDGLLRERRYMAQVVGAPEAYLREGRRFLVACLILGASYGFFMGWHALFSRDAPDVRYAAADMVKVPALFLLTLLVSFPSLYVFSALLGSPFRFSATLLLLLGSTTVAIVTLASFGPVAAFFALCTESYGFMKLLHVAFFALAGAIGSGFVLRELRQVGAGPEPQPGARPADSKGESAVPAVFKVWTIIYALVGAQMSWVLRPFIGAPEMEFSIFRAKEANFFINVWRTIVDLFGV